MIAAMRSWRLNTFPTVVVGASASVATARTAKATRAPPGIATTRRGVARATNALDTARRPKHATPVRTTKRVVIIVAIARLGVGKRGAAVCV